MMHMKNTERAMVQERKQMHLEHMYYVKQGPVEVSGRSSPSLG